MSKGAKVALGCGIAVVAAGIVAAVVLMGTFFWARGKVREAAQPLSEAAEQQKQIEALQERADANSFTPPADGVLQEERLLKFLEVRKRVDAVYQAHKAEFDAMGKEKPQGMEAFKALGKVAALVNGARLAQAQALADLGMSQAEYRYFVEQVYKSMWASEVAKSTGGQSVSETAAQAMQTAADEAEKNAEQAERSGQPPEMVKALRESARQMREQAESARQQARPLDVPPANLALFRKHEDEIKKYGLTGLEWIGL